MELLVKVEEKGNRLVIRELYLTCSEQPLHHTVRPKPQEVDDFLLGQHAKGGLILQLLGLSREEMLHAIHRDGHVLQTRHEHTVGL